MHYYTPVIKIATFVRIHTTSIRILLQKFYLQALSAVLIYFNRRNGLRTSGILFFFWFLLTICSIPRIRTEARGQTALFECDECSWEKYQFISFMIFFSLSCIMFLINCFSDKEPLVAKYEKTEVIYHIII